jgi:hypothetical protein
VRRAAVVLAAAAAAAAVAPAAAQDPGTEVGGTVPSHLALGLSDPEGFATFPAGAGAYELTVRARVTSTDGRVTLSAVDGDVAAGGRLGRLAGRGSVLDAPLEARVGAGPFQPLDAAPAPVLAAFRAPVANAVATIRLRQRIGAGERPRGTYAKTLLITLSADAP